MTIEEYLKKVPAGTRVSLTIGGIKRVGSAFYLWGANSVDACILFDDGTKVQLSPLALPLVVVEETKTLN